MALKLATTDISAVKLGTVSVTKLMLGTTQVWPTTATYPTVAASNSEVGTSLGAANAIPAPTGVAAGNLLIAFAVNDNPSTTDLTASTGWTRLNVTTQGSNVLRMAVFARIADGGANDTLAVTGAGQDYCVTIHRITGHAVVDVAVDISIAAAASSSNGNADPPNLAPGVARHWLWLTAAGIDATTSGTLTVVPSGYTQIGTTLASTGGTSPNSTTSCILAVASKQADATSDNPATFTNTSRPWIGVTVAVPSDVVAPSAPTLNSAIPGNTTVALTWQANATGGAAITDYVIEQSPDGTTGWTIVTEGVSTTPSYTVTGLTNDTIQYFRVYAVNSAGASSPSTVLSATPTAAPWSPASLASLYAWYDASDTASFTFSSGAIVSQWADKKGTRHLTNPTTAEQPNRSGTMNGLPVVTFDGGDDRLMVQSWSSIVAQPLTVYVVAKYTKTGAHQALINVAFNFETKRSSDDTHQFYAGSTYTSNAVTSNAGHVFGAVYGSAVNQQRIDGTQVGTTNTGTNGLDAWHMGRATHGGDPFGGAIAEVVICSAALSGADITSLETYLKTRWGIA